MKRNGIKRSPKIATTTTATKTQASFLYGLISKPKSISRGVGRTMRMVLSCKIGTISNISCRSSLIIYLMKREISQMGIYSFVYHPHGIGRFPKRNLPVVVYSSTKVVITTKNIANYSTPHTMLICWPRYWFCSKVTIRLEVAFPGKILNSSKFSNDINQVAIGPTSSKF